MISDILNDPDNYVLTFRGSRCSNIGVDIISYNVHKHIAVLICHKIPFTTYYPPSGRFVMLSILNEDVK